jgi:hypothetical protein
VGHGASHDQAADPLPLPELASPDTRGKVVELITAQPWWAWKGSELATILRIDNVNSFRVRRELLTVPA